MNLQGLWWLPDHVDWKEKLKATRQAPGWESLVELAGHRMDFVQTGQLDRLLLSLGATTPPIDCAFAPIRLAILSSSTSHQLLSGLRVAALRRGFWMTTYTCGYGQYQQELMDPKSGLHDFAPDVVLICLDAPHVFGETIQLTDDVENVVPTKLEKMAQLWKHAAERFSCQVIQQTILPTLLPTAGNNESRIHGSPHSFVNCFNSQLRAEAEKSRVDLLALDDRVSRDGIDYWHSDSLWHRAKQNVSPAASPLYGDLVVRSIMARRGRSGKCLILDLDNTIWGGVIGDDGLEGIVVGHGSAAGESFLHFQVFAKNLAARGIILAVCSKNDEVNALQPFEQHPDMVLRRSDISSFVANWDDKATNLRRIAAELNIGIDSLVFVDDNPFERNIVRRELPMVMVPELPDDPALYARCISDSGYFETIEVTREDTQRTHLYQNERARERLRESATDIDAYLETLDMKMVWAPFDRVGLQRIVQLINKTNQFNLTTLRYNEAEVASLLDNKNAFGLQFRLADKFGDHGIISVVILTRTEPIAFEIKSWLMSCRVLGRGVEEAVANVVVQETIRRGAENLWGRYIPTQKNGMVRDHYGKLGFERTDEALTGESRWKLALDLYVARKTFISLTEGK